MQFMAPVKERPKRRDGPGCRHKPNKGGLGNLAREFGVIDSAACGPSARA